MIRGRRWKIRLVLKCVYVKEEESDHVSILLKSCLLQHLKSGTDCLFMWKTTWEPNFYFRKNNGMAHQLSRKPLNLSFMHPKATLATPLSPRGSASGDNHHQSFISPCNMHSLCEQIQTEASMWAWRLSLISSISDCY